ncbi:class I SAM-dependent methyltransferase [candidate division KSB1 bacterium]|nr:class I SAM-dependent methyltransferase [candidate division KSB1 bacterium]
MTKSKGQMAGGDLQTCNLQLVTCPLCGAEKAEPYAEAPDRFFPKSGELYSLRRCVQCNMVYLNPRPREADSGRFYEHAEYLPFASLQRNRSLINQIYELLRRVNLHWKRRMIIDFWQRKRDDREVASGKYASDSPLDLQSANLQTCRLLDIGCGTGEFLATMKAAGWQVEGLERDERAAAWAREHHQIAISAGSVEQLSASTQQYDVITLWHVLEHLYDPGQALEIIARRLRENGVLLIAVPNIAGIDARIYKSNWVALDAPRHVNHFSLDTLARLGSKHGLTLRWWRQLPLDAFFNALMSEKLAAQRRRGRWVLWPLCLVRAPLVALASLIGGSHTPFSYAAYGASLVCFLEKSHVTQTARLSKHK